ncbi:bifunctional methylenetetrahydrofolate dehydrogenase/methenyltetrahydrofolate cyclohydrolase FolD [Candidatus Woesearchaeota archaeon]|nr:bifunctional methylenetetrahydrofolate dehydrogenase/methenyltetrahydrofolate cyclohydrolase FolD [Candidatus Woesearchaeota archaeon]
MATILDGKKTAEKIRNGLAERIKGVKPGLAVVLVGNDPASVTYVASKEKACSEIGIFSEIHRLPESAKQQELISLVKKLSSESRIHGILVQLPLPPNVDKDEVIESIAVEKDVDGFTRLNMGGLASGRKCIFPCTPKGIIRLLDEYGIPIEGKNVVVIGRGQSVGKPLALMLINRSATVTVCHSKTKNLEDHAKKADILIAAVGKPDFITADMIKEGAVVIDVGINRINGRLCGDVDFESVKKKAGFITPVPGGVGPMTVAMLLENTVECFERSEHSKTNKN